MKLLSFVRLFATPWSLPGSSIHGSELLFPSPGDLPDPGIEPQCPALQADALLSEPPGNPLVELQNFKSGQIKKKKKNLQQTIPKS